MTTRLYLAGPMSGLPDFNIPAFDEAAHQLRAAGFGVINPADVGRGQPQAHWVWYMRRALENLAQADGIALLPGWEKSKGATLERTIALALGMPVLDWDAWLIRCTESRAPQTSD